MAVELLPSTMNGKTREATSLKAEYKLRKHRLEKLDQAIAELPKCFDTTLGSLDSYCTSGRRLASLLEVVLEGSPLLMVALRYKDACEQLSEKCNRQEVLLQQEFVTACKKVGPSVSSLRSCLDAHAKLSLKYESAQNQLETVANTEAKSKAKVDQAELKFQNALKEFSNQDSLLAKTTNDLDNTRLNVSGSL